jgi:hypothetical protein
MQYAEILKHHSQPSAAGRERQLLNPVGRDQPGDGPNVVARLAPILSTDLLIRAYTCRSLGSSCSKKCSNHRKGVDVSFAQW